MANPTDITPACRVQLRRTFETPPERLFAAWTTPEELRRWHAPGPLSCVLAEVDLRVGGRYRIHMRAPEGKEHHVSGVYRVVEPGRKLVYTWKWETATTNNEQADTLVTVEFVPKGTGTELVLTHEGFASEEARRNHEQGWTGIMEKVGGRFSPIENQKGVEQ
jgi:uncharacterized protein YndB with AHSA1/START domain